MVAREHYRSDARGGGPGRTEEADAERERAHAQAGNNLRVLLWAHTREWRT